MPPEDWLPGHQRGHGLHPARVVELGQASVHRVLYILKSIPALECIAPAAGRARDLHQLAACNALRRRQVDLRTGHLVGLAQAPGYESCFFF